MDKLLEKLSQYGADIDGAMARFLDDADLYRSCFASVLADPTFSALGQALQRQDYETAFDCAHTLKGVTGNMGLTPLYAPICAIVEALRQNEYSALQSRYTQVLAQLEQLKSL